MKAFFEQGTRTWHETIKRRKSIHRFSHFLRPFKREIIMSACLSFPLCSLRARFKSRKYTLLLYKSILICIIWPVRCISRLRSRDSNFWLFSEDEVQWPRLTKCSFHSAPLFYVTVCLQKDFYSRYGNCSPASSSSPSSLDS